MLFVEFQQDQLRVLAPDLDDRPGFGMQVFNGPGLGDHFVDEDRPKAGGQAMHAGAGDGPPADPLGRVAPLQLEQLLLQHLDRAAVVPPIAAVDDPSPFAEHDQLDADRTDVNAYRVNALSGRTGHVTFLYGS